MSTVSPDLDLHPGAPNGDTHGAAPAWKRELQEKLAASRARRGGRPDISTRQRVSGEQAGASASGRAATVAAAVAARYAQAPSYRDLLAEEAHAAAEAAAKAAREAHAAAEEAVARMQAVREADAMASAGWTPQDAEAETQGTAQRGGLEREQVAVRLEVDARTQRHMQAQEARLWARESAPERSAFVPAMPSLADPVEEELVTPATPLAANLIEFPRELVAPRKARPRIAEGPLREEGPEGASLRIFEVGEQAAAHAPEWQAIRLDASPAAQARRHARAEGLELPLQAAPVADRLMAALVDGALAFTGFLMFVFAFYACAAHPPSGKAAVGGAAAAFAVAMVLYQMVFFSFGESTPGMLYAQIALCTLDDKTPTRKAMRLRIGALLLAGLPAGLGLLWAIFDEDRLGWHDRISGTYQRSCR